MASVESVIKRGVEANAKADLAEGADVGKYGLIAGAKANYNE
jgi:hypothetical protein